MPMKTTLPSRRGSASRRALTTCSTISPTESWRSKPALAGGAESAPHGTARLARDAYRGPVGVKHQYRLYSALVRQCPQPFGRLPVRADASVRLRGGQGSRAASEPFAKLLGQVRHVGRASASFPQASPDLLGAVPGFVRKQVGQTLPAYFEPAQIGHRAASAVSLGGAGNELLNDVTQSPTNVNSATMVGGR